MKTQRKKGRKVSFLMAILLSGILFNLIGWIGRNSAYQGYQLNLWKKPLLTVMFEGLADRIYPWEAITLAASDQKVEATSVAVDQMDGQKEEEDSSPSSYAASSQESNPMHKEQQVSEKLTPAKKPLKPAVMPDDKKNQPDENPEMPAEKTSGMNPDSQEKPAEEASDAKEKPDNEEKPEKEQAKEQKSTKKQAEFQEVEKEYFDDVLFIGDSRTVGLSEYSSLDNATYYCDVGLSVYTVFEKEIAKVGKHNVTIEKALQKKTFKKIYIMLGINELGTGTVKTFTAKYQEMLDRIQELQPEADLIVEAIMNVGKEKSDSDPIYNNTNINERNEGLKTLADGKSIFYLDANPVLTDEEGNLPKEHTFDGVHLLAKYYKDWADFLLANGIVRN